MGYLVPDLRYAIRSLVRQPSFAILGVLTLALGVGANTAMFSVVDAVLLRPLPYLHADRLVVLANFWTKRGVTGSVSGPDYHDWHDGTSAYDAMAYYTYSTDGDAPVETGGAVDYAAVVLVAPEFFDVFERQPIVGRTLSRRDTEPGAVVSEAFARRHFSGAADALGRSIEISRRSLPIVGVMPASFGFPARTEVWISASTHTETTSRSAHNYRVVARLRADATAVAAQSELATLAARLEAEYPATNANKSAAVIPLQEQLVGGSRATLLMLFGVVAFVLLIACANVANLLLARATGRASELAIRAALGAGRGRLVAQLMTESLLLAALAAAAGVLLARWAVAAFVAFAPAGLPRLDEVHIDARVFLFALAAAAIASVVFGVVPALHATRVDLYGMLRQGGRGAVASGGAWQRVLVVGEMALAVGLVVAAALLVRSFGALSGVELGYATEQRLVVQTTIPFADLAGARRATATYGEVLRRVAAVPGVRSAAGVRGLPGTDMHSNGGYWLDGGPGPDATGVRAPQAVFTVVTPQYFRTMAIPQRDGRDFSAADTFDAPRVAIVNEALARQAFPNGDAIGRRIMCGLDSLDFMTIVGIVGNVREYDPSTAPLPEIYMPYQQHPSYGTSLRLVAQVSGEPLALADTLRTTIRGVDPGIPTRMSTMTATIGESVATPRFRTWLVGGFALLALLLAMAGVYGVMSYLVSRRTAEIGVRMAMGATASDILRLVAGEGLRLAVVGIAIGSVLAIVLAQSLRGMLFGVAPIDPFVFIGVPLAIVGTAVIATAVPALRASRVDPVTALSA